MKRTKNKNENKKKREFSRFCSTFLENEYYLFIKHAKPLKKHAAMLNVSESC